MAKFTRIDKGCWIYRRGAIYQVLIIKDNRRLRESLETERRDVAEGLAKKRRIQILENGKLEHRLTFCQAVELYRREWSSLHNDDKTWTLEKRTFDHFHASLGKDKPLEDIVEKDVTDYQKWEKGVGKVADTTNNQRIGNLKKLFRRLVKMGLLKASPAQNVEKIACFVHRRFVPTVDEVLQLLGHADGYVYDLIIILVNCGLRLGEALALKTSGVDFNRQELLVLNQKCKREEAVPLNGPAVDVLRRLVLSAGQDGLLFTQDGKPIPGGRAYRKILTAARRAGLPVLVGNRKGFSPHSLRRVCLTEVARRHGIEAARQVGRHKTLKMTIGYMGDMNAVPIAIGG